MSGFDSHFLVQGLKNKSKAELRKLKISAMAHNTNRLRLIRFKEFTFCDSLSFFEAGLETVVETLKNSNHDFPMLAASNLASTPEQLEMLKMKLPFPYSSVVSLSCLHEMTEVPPRSGYDNDLSGEKASAETHEFAKKIYRTFGCTHFGEMLKLYNRLDVYLLAECISVFRDAVFKYFGLDMVQYLSLSSLAFASYLKQSEVNIPLINDRETYDLIESQIRGMSDPTALHAFIFFLFLHRWPEFRARQIRLFNRQAQSHVV